MFALKMSEDETNTGGISQNRIHCEMSVQMLLEPELYLQVDSVEQGYVLKIVSGDNDETLLKVPCLIISSKNRTNL